MKPGPGHDARFRYDYSRLIRTAAAAASGASVTPSTTRAASSSSGANGSVSSDSSAPLRLIPSVRAAPIEPMRLNATLPTATEATIPGTAAVETPSDNAASGAISASGNPVNNQCAAVFANISQVSD